MALNTNKKETYTSLLNEFVNKEDLHDLLKAQKESHKEIIKLSGNKSDLIVNIFEAIDQEILEESTLQEIIRDAEEYGDQHLFVYELINEGEKRKYDNGASLAGSIIPRGLSFPRLMFIPQQLEWVDFRAPNRGFDDSWIIKLYDVKHREIKENEEFDSITFRRTVVFRRDTARLIYCIEWDGISEVQIKISRSHFDSRKGLQSSLSQIRNLIYDAGNGVALDRDFAEVDFSAGINNLIRNSIENQHIFKVQSANFVDSEGGQASFKSLDNHADQDLLSEGSRRGAIELYLEGETSGTALVLKFLASGSNGTLANDVAIIIGRDKNNHLIIPSRIKPQEYRYVRRKIAEFS